MSNSNLFDLVPDRKTAILIDGANFNAALKSIDAQMDYMALRDHIDSNCENPRLTFFTGMYEDEAGQRPLQPLVDMLSTNGFQTITHPVDSSNRFDNTSEVELVTFAMTMLKNDAIGHLVIFASTGNYAPLLRTMRMFNIRTTVVANPDSMSQELKRQADDIISVADVAKAFPRSKNRE